MSSVPLDSLLSDVLDEFETVRSLETELAGDWAEDRLIPDILKSFEKKNPVMVRNPMATRPWQHVLEPLSGYLVLAEHLFNEGKSFAEA